MSCIRVPQGFRLLEKTIAFVFYAYVDGMERYEIIGQAFHWCLVILSCDGDLKKKVIGLWKIIIVRRG